RRRPSASSLAAPAPRSALPPPPSPRTGTPPPPPHACVLPTSRDLLRRARGIHGAGLSLNSQSETTPGRSPWRRRTPTAAGVSAPPGPPRRRRVLSALVRGPAAAAAAATGRPLARLADGQRAAAERLPVQGAHRGLGLRIGRHLDE